MAKNAENSKEEKKVEKEVEEEEEEEEEEHSAWCFYIINLTITILEKNGPHVVMNSLT